MCLHQKSRNKKINKIVEKVSEFRKFKGYKVNNTKINYTFININRKQFHLK